MERSEGEGGPSVVSGARPGVKNNGFEVLWYGFSVMR